jgi:hypothetical protein
MIAEARRRGKSPRWPARPMNELREIVEKYLALAGGFGTAIALSSFELGMEESVRLFSALDEDYQISRYLEFSRRTGTEFSINGFPQTHVALDEGIRGLL